MLEGTGKQMLSPWVAVRRGHLFVTLPIVVIIGVAYFATRSILGPSHDVVGFVVGFILAWAYWSFSIPKWRDWLGEQNCDEAAVQRLAQATGLVWRKGSIFGKTELPRKGERPRPP